MGFVDYGTYFMSICADVQAQCEAWLGVDPGVTAVMRMMQEGLQGRAETAYGLTELFDMLGVACGQGHELAGVQPDAWLQGVTPSAGGVRAAGGEVPGASMSGSVRISVANPPGVSHWEESSSPSSLPPVLSATPAGSGYRLRISR